MLEISEKEPPGYNHLIENLGKVSGDKYEAFLPFKENCPSIYDHFELSRKRLISTCKHFKEDKEFLK